MPLFNSQNQIEQDLTNGPGWTIDDQKPSFFDNALEAIPRGIGQGAADGLDVLTHGLQYGGHASPMEAVMSGPASAAVATRELVTGQKAADSPWKQSWDAGADEVRANARDFSKSLIPDPRITGAGANIIQGLSKALTEFGAGTVAGGPLGGAALMGATEGYAHYQDLRDQGVDEETAKQSGLLEAVTSGGSALLPMGMPARWLKGLSTAGTLVAQAGAGAVINTSFGAASRYASAKILDDAGYHEMAEQQKPWDETNLVTDALSGLFFGAHAGYHGLQHLDATNVDPSIRDAAKVVQDRQEVADRAPGVPVDMKSAAVHRQALESALGDLMSGRNVDLGHVDTDGATFARPDIDESQSRDIMREEFMKSGVLDDASAFDRWLKGEPTDESPQTAQVAPVQSIDSVNPQDVAPPKSVGLREPVDATEANLAKHIAENPDTAIGGYLNPETGQVHLDAKTEAGAVRLPEGNLGEAHGEGTRADGQAENGAARPTTAGEAGSVRSDQGGQPAAGSEPGAGRGTGESRLADTVTAATQSRPDLKIVNGDGDVLHAGDEHAKAIADEAQANQEADPMFQAAVGCEARFH